MTTQDHDDHEFEELQWLVAQGTDGARERRDALIDRRASEWASVEGALKDEPVWPTQLVHPGPEDVRAAYEAAPVTLVDCQLGEVTGVRPPTPL